MVDSRLRLTSQAASALNGELYVPGDKSISHRAIILASIADGVSEIHGLLEGADNKATITIFKQLGVDIERVVGGHYRVQGVGLHGLQAPQHPLDCGNSGTAMRLLSGLLAAQSFDSVLMGDASLTKRPMARVALPLRDMGAKIELSDANTAPISIYASQDLTGIDYPSPVASAQVKSSVLLAGLYATGETTVTEPRQSRDHTERLLTAFGSKIMRDQARVTVHGGHALKAIDLQVPSDISSAAFFMVAATITPGSDIILKNIGINPTRNGIINLLNTMGANIEFQNERIINDEPVADIRVRYAKLHGITMDESVVPSTMDEFPVLFIAAACASGKTVLTGAKELRVKETDRIAAMVDGLVACGIVARPLGEDGIVIEGGQLRGGEVDSQGDHRIAMAFAVAGCVADAPITILDCANIQTSFPNFLQLANQIGMQII